MYWQLFKCKEHTPIDSQTSVVEPSVEFWLTRHHDMAYTGNSQTPELVLATPATTDGFELINWFSVCRNTLQFMRLMDLSTDRELLAWIWCIWQPVHVLPDRPHFLAP
jgi:hypothetical protein